MPYSNKGSKPQYTPEYYTPAEFAEAARYVLGGIDLDPASNARANKTVRAETYYTKRHNGLIKPWHGRVYCNAPGDRQGTLVPAFWRRCCMHALAGHGPVLWAGFTVEQLRSLQRCEPLDDGRPCPLPFDFPRVILSSRVHWVRGDGERSNPGSGNFFCLLGGSATMKHRFRVRFSEFGAYIPPRRRYTQRDIAAELVTSLLEQGPAASKSELARRIRARRATVIYVLDLLLAQEAVHSIDGEFAVPAGREQ